MSAQQTSYVLEQTAPIQPGLVMDATRIRAFRNDNANPVDFGLAVSRSTNTDDRGFDTLVTTRQFLGVNAWGHIQANALQGQTAIAGVKTLEMGSILEEGEIMVKVVETVTPDSPVRVYIVDNTGTLAGTVLGAFGTAAVTAKTALIANAKYVSRATAGNLAKLRLNSPAPVLLTAD